MARETREQYAGFEQGPIRPPSEAYSLLIRVTRNCPWNRCTFCVVYKGQKFELRNVENVKRDIDAVSRHVEVLRKLSDDAGFITQSQVRAAAEGLGPDEMDAFAAAVHWSAAGMTSIFIQDANSLIMKPAELVEVLNHLKKRFPWVERVTSYARSHTLARTKPDDMKAIGEAGLNRIHVGMESGSDRVLKMVQSGSDRVLKMVHKGVTKQRHIEGGLRVKEAGIELSEYVMPGLGGAELSREHALETADALNQIDADFIRLRTTRIFPGIPLYDRWQQGRFTKLSEAETAEEILRFIEALDGIESTVKSDHMNNLLEDVEGKLPGDKGKMMERIRSFLELDAEKQAVYFFGRGIGMFRGVGDMEDAGRLQSVRQAYDRVGATPETVEGIIMELRAGRM
jgi:radical SAM superfamily enzyme YgiQ (UPF0313 family)